MSRLKSGWPGWLAALVGWVALGGLAPAPGAPRLAYALNPGFAMGQTLTYATAALPAVERGAAKPGISPIARRGIHAAGWRLTVDVGMVADSNVTNAGRDRSIPFLADGGLTPVEIDPAFRARGGTGRVASVTGGVKLRLSDGMAIAVDAEGQAVDYKGSRDDDISFLLAAGPEVTWSSGSKASVQMVAARNSYGGRSLKGGLGVRARYQMPLGEAQRLSFSVDARQFESSYGRDFGGVEAGATLGYSRVLDPVTTASLGVFARRDWLREDAYSGLELGGYGGVSRYLNSWLTGSVSAGLSRTAYDAPLAYLSLEPRNDWRFWAGAQLTTRNPIALGIHPTLSYSYNQSDGSIDFFDSSRHRVRIGVSRAF